MSPNGEVANSPSGYGCDPWSAHLYVSRGIAKNGDTLTLTVVHNPDCEGNANDIEVASGHDHHGQLIVGVPFTTAIRNFVRVAFSSPPGGAALDRSSPTFLTDVANHPESSTVTAVQ
jgi:hypothetical protein